MAMAEALPRLPRNETQWQREIERCRAEIADAERLLRAGHPDVAGLCMALSDWSTELRILEGQIWKCELSNL
jgi:hypothetical protein